MTTVIFTEKFENHQHSGQRIPERRNYTLNSNHRNLRTRITCNICSFDLFCVAVFASHPAIVLFASSWVVAALVYGAFDLQVTTDPVEIWASPQSRSRLEKEYFDSRFEPFYRTEQVFVKAVGIQKVSMRVVQMKPVRRLFWGMD
jgi:Niemann-Pick C1 protein